MLVMAPRWSTAHLNLRAVHFYKLSRNELEQNSKLPLAALPGARRTTSVPWTRVFIYIEIFARGLAFRAARVGT